MEFLRTEIEARLAALRRRVEAAAERAGRDPAEVRIVAVSKGHPAEAIRMAYEAGLRDFGENRVEEAEPKLDALVDLADVRWHMVGHVQSRKARRVAARFDVVHSVDRLKLARRLDRFAGEQGRRLPVLLECNVSGEPTKFGFAAEARERWEEVLAQARRILDLPNLEVLGLMTMAPWSPEPEAARPFFRRLRELRDFLQERLEVALPELSMGMTDDFEPAIEEGATMIRIGRALFGPRPEG